jgi:hypothetical protein
MGPGSPETNFLTYPDEDVNGFFGVLVKARPMAWAIGLAQWLGPPGPGPLKNPFGGPKTPKAFSKEQNGFGAFLDGREGWEKALIFLAYVWAMMGLAILVKVF